MEPRALQPLSPSRHTPPRPFLGHSPLSPAPLAAPAGLSDLSSPPNDFLKSRSGDSSVSPPPAPPVPEVAPRSRAAWLSRVSLLPGAPAAPWPPASRRSVFLCCAGLVPTTGPLHLLFPPPRALAFIWFEAKCCPSERPPLASAGGPGLVPTLFSATLTALLLSPHPSLHSSSATWRCQRWGDTRGSAQHLPAQHYLQALWGRGFSKC